MNKKFERRKRSSKRTGLGFVVGRAGDGHVIVIDVRHGECVVGGGEGRRVVR